MSDVRSLLKNERAARRIQHRYASYSGTGTLLCTVCHLQLKSESLWDGHLRTTGHIMLQQRLQDSEPDPTASETVSNGDGNKKKRKASDDADTIRKRSKAINPSLPEGFFDPGNQEPSHLPEVPTQMPTNEIQMQIPSRPATPIKPIQDVPKRPDVDEDEWAAFEADVAAADDETQAFMGNSGAVISAPAVSAAELKERDIAEANKRRRERLEAEAEGDKEDAAKKLEDEFEEMEGLEERVRRLRERREALRRKDAVGQKSAAPEVPVGDGINADDEEDYDEEDDDDWDGFRMKG